MDDAEVVRLAHRSDDRCQDLECSADGERPARLDVSIEAAAIDELRNLERTTIRKMREVEDAKRVRMREARERVSLLNEVRIRRRRRNCGPQKLDANCT